MRQVLAAVALVAVACGGGEPRANASAEGAAAPPMAAAQEVPAGVTGTVHQVQMLLTADGKYVYEPATLTIKVGDRVRWINVSGGPHNVAFYPDKIPAGAEEVLRASMKEQMSPLAGKLMIQPNEAYEVSFAGTPVGSYAYYCTPHEMLGMKATLTIQQ